MRNNANERAAAQRVRSSYDHLACSRVATFEVDAFGNLLVDQAGELPSLRLVCRPIVCTFRAILGKVRQHQVVDLAIAERDLLPQSTTVFDHRYHVRDPGESPDAHGLVRAAAATCSDKYQ